MPLLNDLQQGMANLAKGQSRGLETEGIPRGSVVVVTNDGWEGVAIPVADDLEFRRDFAHAKMATGRFNGPEDSNFLALLSTRKDLRLEFAHFCLQFLSEGDAVSSDPESWWEKMYDLIGNAQRSETVYPVLGELFVLSRLVERFQNRNWTWEGPARKRHDIEEDAVSIEVKTTLSPDRRVIKINGERQLAPTGEKPLWIAFVRLEESNTGGLSIGALIKAITSSVGPDSPIVHEVHNRLEATGFGAGHPLREKCYSCHGAVMYPVNDKFPKIVPTMFSGGEMPPGIGKLTYEVFLDQVESTELDVWDP